MRHFYGILLAILGAVALYLYTPVPFYAMSCPGIESLQYDWCRENTKARVVGALVGLVGGAILGSIADTALGRKRQPDDHASIEEFSGDTPDPESTDQATLIRGLDGLVKAGILTPEEYEHKKALILAKDD